MSAQGIPRVGDRPVVPVRVTLRRGQRPVPGDLWPRMLGGAAERLDVLVYGIYTNPHHVIEYTSNGEVRQEFSIVFTARPISGTPATSSESSEVVWVPTAEVAQLTMHPTMRQRISHYLEQRPDPYIA